MQCVSHRDSRVTTGTYRTFPDLPVRPTCRTESGVEAGILTDQLRPSVVQGHVGKLLFGLIGPQETSAVFMVGRAQSVN